ncbi:hypothetical protein ACJBCE_36290 [Streptomyces sp. NBUL23]|uniref:hypothetical protein n=1 Tax=Streptomyces sp. NBUL23 TaxID=3381354 RepID=UPI003871CE64
MEHAGNSWWCGINLPGGCGRQLVNRADVEDLKPLLDYYGTPMTFTRWYLTWLEETEHQLVSAAATD